MAETLEDNSTNQEGWFKRNTGNIILLTFIFSHYFVSDWISAPVYFSVGLLVLANIFYLGLRRRHTKGEIVLRYVWGKTNLFVLAAIGTMFAIVFVLGKAFDYLGKFVPESVPVYFSAILVIGLILYLIGAGFYLVEKSIKN